MPVNAELRRRLAQQEKQYAERQRAAYYATPPQLPEWTPEERSHIYGHLIEAGALFGHASTPDGDKLRIELLEALGMSVEDAAEFYAVDDRASDTAQADWFKVWREAHPDARIPPRLEYTTERKRRILAMELETGVFFERSGDPDEMTRKLAILSTLYPDMSMAEMMALFQQPKEIPEETPDDEPVYAAATG